VIERLVPAPVAAAEAFADVDESLMWPEEAEAIARAVSRRRREYGTVRHLARQSLQRLGLPPAAVPAGENREPRWPAGVVGALTHCAGYRAAVLAHARDVHGLGVDAEPHAPLPDGVLGTVARDEELPRLAGLAADHPDVHWDRLLFCAKESVYKVWFPLARCWLGFEDASVTLRPDGTFSAALVEHRLAAGGVERDRLDGRWLAGRGLLVTAITLPAPG
jgi:4'-phosphopantetheinyl transferase EntD